MSAYSSEMWQEGFCTDNQFPRSSDVGFYQEEVTGYLNKGVQNGGSHQFGSSRCGNNGPMKMVFMSSTIKNEQHYKDG